MTFYYFINCVLLTFAPLFFLYKFSPLSECGSVWRCGLAFGGYLLTQTVKLLLMATLMVSLTPAIDYAIDCCGLYYLLLKQQKASLSEVKILSVALGWSFGESLLRRFADFYVNARSLQFDWRHILGAVEANLDLVQHVSICTLLWLVSRGSNNRVKPLIFMSVYLTCLYFLNYGLLWKSMLIAGLTVSTLTTIV